jgi:hypothetical protein
MRIMRRLNASATLISIRLYEAAHAAQTAKATGPTSAVGVEWPLSGVRP